MLWRVLRSMPTLQWCSVENMVLHILLVVVLYRTNVMW